MPAQRLSVWRCPAVAVVPSCLEKSRLPVTVAVSFLARKPQTTGEIRVCFCSSESELPLAKPQALPFSFGGRESQSLCEPGAAGRGQCADSLGGGLVGATDVLTGRRTAQAGAERVALLSHGLLCVREAGSFFLKSPEGRLLCGHPRHTVCRSTSRSSPQKCHGQDEAGVLIHDPVGRALPRRPRTSRARRRPGKLSAATGPCSDPRAELLVCGAPGLHTRGLHGRCSLVRNSVSLFQEHFTAVALVSHLCP